jgi:putative transposase
VPGSFATFIFVNLYFVNENEVMSGLLVGSSVDNSLSMPRRLLIRTADFFYHITSRSNNREWFDLGLEEVWKLATSALCYGEEKVSVKISAFVLMSNHYHLLIRTPNANIDEFMKHFNKKFSDELRKRTGRINRMFGGRYKWSIIKNLSHLYNVYRYIYQNPLRASLVFKCEEYPFSTLYYKVNNKRFPILVEQCVDESDLELLCWLNDDVSLEESSSIRRGLCHGDFTISPERKTRYIPNLKLPFKNKNKNNLGFSDNYNVAKEPGTWYG